MNQESTYNVKVWQKDRKKQIKLIKKLCAYPPSITRARNRNAHSRKKSTTRNKARDKSETNGLSIDKYFDSFAQDSNIPIPRSRQNNRIYQSPFNETTEKNQAERSLLNTAKTPTTPMTADNKYTERKENLEQLFKKIPENPIKSDDSNTEQNGGDYFTSLPI